MTPLPWIILAVAVLMALMPRWTRPDLYFAVTVQTDFAFTPEARRILRQYWLELALHTLVALALASLIGLEKTLAALLSIGWLIIGLMWATARAHSATLEYSATPSPIREADLSPGRQHLPGGWPLALGPLVFLAGAAVYLTIAWEQLPRRIAIHWGFHGADRWIDRTPLNVVIFLSLLASFCGVFLLLSYGTLHWSRRISVSGERARGESFFRGGVLWLLIGMQYLVVVPALLLAFWPEAPAIWIWPTLSLAVIAIALITLVRIGQGGGRVADKAEFQPPIGDHTPDAAWKWGLFYYNPADPALIVEKRFGLGHTLNFGNRWSWLLVVAILLPLGLAITLR